MELDEKMKAYLADEIEKAKHGWKKEAEAGVQKAFHHVIEEEEDEVAVDKLHSAVDALKKHLQEL